MLIPEVDILTHVIVGRGPYALRSFLEERTPRYRIVEQESDIQTVV